jgi:hypothetical protein
MKLDDIKRRDRGLRRAWAIGVASLSACVSLAVLLLVIATPASAAKPGIGSSYAFAFSKTKTYTITLEKIVDPITLSQLSITPMSGTRFIGVEFKIVNTGKKALDIGVDTNTYAVDSATESLQFSPATSTNCQSFDNGAGDAAPVPGSYVVGCVIFAVPKKQKLTKIEFGSGTPVVWNV